jgi:hypothetical protein
MPKTVYHHFKFADEQNCGSSCMNCRAFDELNRGRIQADLWVCLNGGYPADGRLSYKDTQYQFLNSGVGPGLKLLSDTGVFGKVVSRHHKIGAG